MLVNLLIAIAIGAVSGWLAGILMKSKGSLLRNIILGIVGGLLGKFLFGLLGISFGGICSWCLLNYLSCKIIF